MEIKKATGKHNVNIEEKLMNSCRVCMTQNLIMKPIFDNDSNITEKILFCTGLQFSKEDGLPSQICDTCLEDLSIAHKFKTSCIEANDRFQSLIKADIKIELHDAEANEDAWDGDSRSIKEEEFEGDLTSEVCAIDKAEKTRSKRGPYKKTGKPRPLKKLKFKRLWCEPCGLRFTSKLQLDDHRKELHANDEESWVCEICGKVFVHQGSLTSHRRSHLPPEFGCDLCDYKTWNKYDLTKHIRIHKGEKLYQCQHCITAYHTSSNLASHIRRFHIREKNYACEMCDKQFFDKTKYNRHMDSHNNIKRFECEVCHARFTRRCYWKKHLHRQHNIVIPAQRPGKQKVNLLIGQLDPVQSIHKPPE